MVAVDSRLRWAVVLLGAVLALGPILPAGIAHPAGLPSSPGGSGSLGASPLRVAHPHALGLPSAYQAPGPAANQVWYTQVGATLAQFNSSVSQTGVASLSEDIPLVNSPYPIGYELNGLSNRGDWYQVVVGVNWPGCSGLEMITEVWDNLQNSGPVNCLTTVPMSFGDLIRLNLSLPTSSTACLGLSDVSGGHHQTVCQGQPNSGASKFIVLSTPSDANGYFTGPMTEIANTTATACPDYTHMPLVNYEYRASFGISEYVAWSDEFELTTLTNCYGSGGSLISFSAGDPATSYVDTASGTSYGPHYVAGQPYGMVSPAYGFRIQTDPVPLTGVGLSASASTVSIGGNVTLTASVSGGVSPYTAIWALNGTVTGNGSLQRTWVATAAGTYRFQAYGVDAHLDVVGPSATSTVLVNGPLGSSAISASGPTGNADVGQTVVFRVTALGGIPPYSYAWSGLPVECPAGNVPSVACTPGTAANYTVDVIVGDANGSHVDAGGRAFTVSPALSPQLQVTPTAADVNQSVSLVTTVGGGSGGLGFTWTGLPPPCRAVSVAIVRCTVSTPGLYTPAVTVADSNGATAATAGIALQVFSAPAIGLTVNRLTADAGVAMTFTATPSGGAGNYLLSWNGLPSNCPSVNSAVLVCAPANGGTYSVGVTLTDAVGGVVTSPSVIVYAYSALNLSVVGPGTVAVGSLLSASVNISGGAPSVQVQWSGLPDGCPPPASAELTCQPTVAGEYNITVTVSDGGGGVSQVTYHLSVTTPAGAGGLASSPTLPLMVLLAAVVAAVGIAAAVAARRRRSGPTE